MSDLPQDVFPEQPVPRDEWMAMARFISRLVDCPPEGDMPQAIAEGLAEATGALGVSVSEYDESEGALISRAFAAAPPAVSRVLSMLGEGLVGRRMRVTPEQRETLGRELVVYTRDLVEASFGTLDPALARAVSDGMGLGVIARVAFTDAGRLTASAILFLPQGAPAPPPGLLRAIASSGSVFLRQKDVTGRLWASQERLGAFLAASLDGVFITSPRGDVLYCNQVACQLLGMDAPARAVGRYLPACLPRADRRAFAASLGGVGVRALKNATVRIRRPDGLASVVDLSISPVESQKGRQAGHLVIVRDVTARSLAEAAQRVLYGISAAARTASGEMELMTEVRRLLTREVGALDVRLVRAGARPDPEPSAPGTAARFTCTSVPLTSTGAAAGVLEVDVGAVHYDEASCRLFLGTIAPELSVALEHVGARAQLDSHRERLEALVSARTEALEAAVARLERQSRERALLDRVRSALVGELNMAVMIRNVVRAIVDSFGYTQVSVYLLRGDALVLQEQVGYTTVLERIPVDTGVCGEVVRTGRPVFVQDAASDPRFLKTVEGITSEVCVPLRERERVVGVLNVESIGEARLAEEDLGLMEALSEHVGAALVSASLHTSLARSEERYRFLVERQGEGVTTVDMADRFLFANPAAERAFGVPRGSLPGRYVAEFLDETHLAILEEQNHRRALGESSSYEIEIVRPDGERRFLLVNATPLRDEASRQSGSLAVFWDYTERKRMEEDLKEAMRAAEAASRAKSEFLGLMSHELRTPLNAVLGMLGLLHESPLSAEQKELVEDARSGGNTLLAIIQDLLDLSRIEAGRMDLAREPVSVRGCVETAVDLASAPAAKKGLTLTWKVDDSVPAEVVGDRGRITQVLANLLSNAVKFTQTGGVEVTAIRVPAPSGAVGRSVLEFRVRDTGIGVRPEDMGRLFQPFSQVQSTRTRSFGGTGLGLAICRRLCELMDGTIGVESEGVAGRGSIFHFTIQVPVQEGQRQEPVPAGRAQGSPGMDGKPRRTLRILVADDAELNLRLFSKLLTTLGHEVATAASGGEVVRSALSGTWDVILMDVHMPDMSGPQAAHLIRDAHAGRPAPYIVAVTGSLDEADMRRCQEAGMQGYLVKPVRLADLERALAAAQTAGAGAAAAPGAGSVPPTVPEDPRSFDRRVLDDLSLHLGPRGAEEARELGRISRESGARVMEDMAAAAAVGEAGRLRLCAHSLKSIAASVGAPRLRGLCEAVEAEARGVQGSPGAPAPTGWPDRIMEIRAEFEKAMQALDRWRPRESGGASAR